MTTDDLIRTIKKFTEANGRGPSSNAELQMALANELNTPIADVDLMDELEKAVSAGFIGHDDKGCLVVL